MARRAVTRNLIKRKARDAWARLARELPAGDWVLRLRAPVPREQFPSANSEALRRRVGTELDTVFQAARRGPRRSRDSGSDQPSICRPGGPPLDCAGR